MRLLPSTRKLMVEAYERFKNIKIVAEVFGVTRQTATFWIKGKGRKGMLRYHDKQRKPKESKVTLEVELAILSMHTLFGWGTARIQQGLRNLPDFAKKALQNTVENVSLSRAAINDVLKKHKLNGYRKNAKKWKFFRAKEPNELWQLDLKGPFTVQGKKYYFLVCIDDYGRYMLVAEQFDHSPKTKEIIEVLEKIKNKPCSILTDNAKIFAKKWKRWCKSNGIEPLYAYPYYPQDKGKVERTIRTIAEEFIHLIVKFPEWLNGMIKEYVKWYNEKRYHRGIDDIPAKLYVKLET